MALDGYTATEKGIWTEFESGTLHSVLRCHLTYKKIVATQQTLYVLRSAHCYTSFGTFATQQNYLQHTVPALPHRSFLQHHTVPLEMATQPARDERVTRLATQQPKTHVSKTTD